MEQEIIEEVEQLEPEQQGPGDPPTKASKLYQNLINEGYTKDNIGDEQEFIKALQDSAKASKIYNSLIADGYTEDNIGKHDDFIKEFATIKKKVGSINFEKSSLEYGNTTSAPTQSESLSIEEGSIDPITGTLKQIKEFEETKIPVSKVYPSSMGATVGTEYQPDPVAAENAKKAKQLFKDTYGVDADEFSEDIKELPEVATKQAGFTLPELVEIKKNNRQNYERRIATAKLQIGLKDAINKQFEDGNINEDQRKSLIKTARNNTDAYGIGDYDQQRNSVKNQVSLINLYGGENREKLLNDLAVERSKTYGDYWLNNGKEYLGKDPRKEFLNEYQTLYLQYLGDIDPQKAASFNSVLIDPKKIQDNTDAKAGWESKMYNLEMGGLSLVMNAIQEDLNTLNEVASKQGDLTPVQKEKYASLILKQEELAKAESELNVKYWTPGFYDRKKVVQEILGQENKGVNYFFSKTGESVYNTLKGVKDFATEMVGSEEANKINQLEAIGGSDAGEVINYLTQKNSALQSFELKVKPQLQQQIDVVKNDENLNYNQKSDKIYNLLRDNPDDWGRVPIKGGKTNINPSSLFYSVSGLAATLVPYMALEAATGGGATAGLTKKLVSSFTAAAATSFHDTYSQAVKEGISNPFGYALRVTAINSAAMAGAGTPDLVRKMLGTKSAIGELVSKMGDDEIMAMMKKTPSSLKTFGKTIKPLQAVGNAVSEGVKGGAKFEGIMAGAQVLNDKISGVDTDPEMLAKKAAVGVLTFGAFAGLTGSRGQYKKLDALEKGTLFKAAQNKEQYIQAATEQLRDGLITRQQFDNIKANIEKAETVVGKTEFVNNRGKELSEKEKAELLTIKIEEFEIKEQLKKDIPEKLKENLEGKLEELKSEASEVYTGKFEKESTPEIQNEKSKEVDTKLSQPIEGLNEQGIPLGENVPPPTKTENGVIVESPANFPESITIQKNDVRIQKPIQEEALQITAETNPANEPVEVGGIYTDPKRTVLSFRGLQEIATEFNMSDITGRDTKTDLQLIKDAETTANKWAEEGKYKTQIEKLIQTAERKEPISDEQRIILQQHIANLREQAAQLRGKPSYDAKLKELERVVTASKESRSAAGAALRVPDYTSMYEPTMEDWMVQKMEANSVDVLTDAQKAEVKKQFENYEEKSKNADAKVQEMNDEIAKLKAELALANEKGGKYIVRKKNRENLKKEREDILLSIKDKLKKARGESNITIVPYAKELFAIAPDVTKLVRNLLEDGVSRLQDVVDNVYDVLKDNMPYINKKDIHNIIAGEYNEKKPTKSAAAARMKDLRDEAILINKLESLMNGETPKNERKKVDRNREIKKLQEKIKDFKREKDELDKKNLEEQLQEESEIQDFEKEKQREFDNSAKSKGDFNKQLNKHLSKKTPDEIVLESIKKRNEVETKKLKERIKNNDFAPEKKISLDENEALKKANPQLWKAAMDAIAARNKAREEFEYSKRKDELSKRGNFRKAVDFAAKIIATSRAVKAGIDDSITFVQLGMAVMANPTSAAKAKWKAIQAVSDKNFQRQLTALHNSPYWDVIQKSGLDITEPKSDVKEKTEELYADNLLNKDFKIGDKKYNVWKHTGGVFERLFTSMGNNMRVNLFLKRMEQLQNERKSFASHPQEYKDAARVINELTGRGKMNKYLEMASPAITPFIWAPKMLASSLNLLGLSDAAGIVTGKKGFYSGLTPVQRKYALTQMGKGIGMGVILMVIAAMNGWEVDYDPRSVTFGSIKHGTKSYNVFGRYASTARAFTQLATGTKTADGEKTDLDEKGGRDVVLGKFLRGKMTPISGLAYDFIFNKQQNMYTREPITWSSLPNDLLTPISIGDLKKGMEQDGTISLLTRFLPAFEGISVSDERDFKKDEKPGINTYRK